jgi:predicted MarR family transcription regulator
MAVFGSVIGFCHVAAGFTNGELVKQVLALGQEQYNRRKATYDLRRLKRKGMITRIKGSRRYQLTALGRSVAVLFTKTHDRVLAPGLIALDLRLPESVARRSNLSMTWRSFEHALEEHVKNGLVAA